MSRGRQISSLNHGEYGFAKRTKCECDVCVTGRRRYDKRVRYEKLLGNSRRVDATEAREHVQRLREAGLSYDQMSRATDRLVRDNQLRRLVEGSHAGKEVTYLMRDTVDVILGITYEAAAALDGLMPAVGVQRRLQALAFMGYSTSMIYKRLGVSESAYHAYMRKTQLKRATMQKVDALYRELGMTPGPSNRARYDAYRKEWLPPMAWEDSTIDDPNAKPDRSVVRCVVESCVRATYKKSLCETHYYLVRDGGGLEDAVRYTALVRRIGKNHIAHSPDALREDVADLKAQGYTIERAAMRLGKATKTIERHWKEDVA